MTPNRTISPASPQTESPPPPAEGGSDHHRPQGARRPHLCAALPHLVRQGHAAGHPRDAVDDAGAARHGGRRFDFLRGGGGCGLGRRGGVWFVAWRVAAARRTNSRLSRVISQPKKSVISTARRVIQSNPSNNCQVEYAIQDMGYLRFYLAPKIEDDDMEGEDEAP
jgi:hypothetical protein